MATLNRQKERISAKAKGAHNEPRWLGAAITASSIVILAGLAMMVTAGKTGHINLAWAGVSSFTVGTVGWLISFGWFVVLVVRDAWATRHATLGLLFGRMLNRGGNRKIDADTE